MITINTIKIQASVILFYFTFLPMDYFSQNKTNNNMPYVKSNAIKVQNDIAIQLGDSAARSELKIYNDTHSNTLSEGQLSLEYYDKTIEALKKNINAYEVKYRYNQPLHGKVLFFLFSVIVNIDTKDTKFISDSPLCGGVRGVK